MGRFSDPIHFLCIIQSSKLPIHIVLVMYNIFFLYYTFIQKKTILYQTTCTDDVNKNDVIKLVF